MLLLPAILSESFLKLDLGIKMKLSYLILIIFSYFTAIAVKAQEAVITGESQNVSSVKLVNYSLFAENQRDALEQRINEVSLKNSDININKIEFLDLETKISQEDNLYSENSKIDTTSSNDLNFDDENANIQSDPNMGLLPKNISWMESLLWSKNGFFRKVGITSDLTTDQRTKEIGWRRTILTAHQTSGLITLGLMLASCYTGQIWLDGKSQTPDVHKAFVTSTIIGYSLTGLLATIAPPPSIRRDEFSTITVHKTLAWLHFAGMIATPILGKLINERTDYYTAARYHQVSAYITTGIYATAMAVILLFQ